MPPPEAYKSEIGIQPKMCQVHTGAYVSLLAPGETDYYNTSCHPSKTTTYILHVVPITTHTHDRRKSIGKKKQRKEKKIKERKEKTRKRRKRKRKGKKRKDKKSKEKRDKERRQGTFFFLFSRTFTFQVLDNKPWSQVSSLLPPGSCLQLSSRIRRVQQSHCSSIFHRFFFFFFFYPPADGEK